jgi:hypothetical protein
MREKTRERERERERERWHTCSWKEQQESNTNPSELSCSHPWRWFKTPSRLCKAFLHLSHGFSTAPTIIASLLPLSSHQIPKSEHTKTIQQQQHHTNNLGRRPSREREREQLATILFFSDSVAVLCWKLRHLSSHGIYCGVGPIIITATRK